MKCPGCGSLSVYTTNTYPVSDFMRLQRRLCKSCNKALTVKVTEEIIHFDPKRGQGAESIAKNKALTVVRSEPCGTEIIVEGGSRS